MGSFEQRPWVRVLAVSGAVLLACLVVVTALALSQVDRIATQVVARALPELSSRLDRTVSVGVVDATFFPLSVELQSVALAGAPGEPPLVSAQTVRGHLDVWTLFRTLGRKVAIHSLSVDGMRVQLVKRADGSWSHQEVLDRLQARPVTREAEIESLSLRGGTLIVVRGARPQQMLEQVELNARNLASASPMQIEGRAALAGQDQNLHLQLQVTPSRVHRFPKLEGSLSLRALGVEGLQSLLPSGLGPSVSGGRLDLRAQVSTRPDARYELSGKASLDSLQLRSEPIAGSTQFVALIPPSAPRRASLALQNLRVQGRGVDLAGTAKARFEPLAIDVALHGRELDLDQVLGRRGQVGEAESVWIPSSVRRAASRLRVEGRLSFDRLARGSLELHEVSTRFSLRDGTLRAEEGSARLFEGEVKVELVSVALRAVPQWKLQLSLNDVDVGRALTGLAGVHTVQGQLSGVLRLQGDGNNWEQLRGQLHGSGRVRLEDATIAAPLAQPVLELLSQALPLIGQPSPGVGPSDERTPLAPWTSRIVIRQGWVEFGDWLQAPAPFGLIRLRGKVGLDQALQLTGEAVLSPPFVQQWLGGAWMVDETISIPLQVTGTVQQPKVSPRINPEALARTLARAVLRSPSRKLDEALPQGVREGMEELLDFLRR